MDDDYYYTGKNMDLPRQKEFSFDKIENDNLQQINNDTTMTAHFNKNNLLSKAKEAANNKCYKQISEFKENQRPHYHCHYANEDTPEAFRLDINNSRRQSLSQLNQSLNQQSNKEISIDKSHKKQRIKMNI